MIPSRHELKAQGYIRTSQKMPRLLDIRVVKTWLIALYISTIQQCCFGLQQLLHTDKIQTCGQPHYYEPDSIYLIQANSSVTGNKCQITFTEFTWGDANKDHHCYSLCINLKKYNMHSCDFKMTYHDGLGDVKPTSFDCHTFPPLMWCSSKKDLKIEFKELKKYKGEGYLIVLEVKSYCAKDKAGLIPEGERDSKTYLERLKEEEKRQRDTVIITGSLVSTVSFMLVIFWVTYCCWKRRNTPREQRSTTATSSQGSGSSRSQNNKHPGQSPNNRPPAESHFPANLNRDVQPSHWYPMHMVPLQHQPPHMQNQSQLMNQGYQQADARYTKLPELHSLHQPESLFVPPGMHRGSPTKDQIMSEDNPLLLRPPYIPDNVRGAQNSYDADIDVPYIEPVQQQQPPPLPPRPNFPPYTSKQYFI